MIEQIPINTNKSYQLDFLKVPFLNCSMKGPVSGYFDRAPCW